MKKSILLTLALLMSCSVVKAVDWQEIYIGSDDSVLYIDSDTIQQGKYEDEYLYAVRFVNKGSKEKVAYIKSDFANNLIGIIRVEDYESDKYRPSVYLTNPHAFMKPFKDTSLVYVAHDTVASLTENFRVAQKETNKNEVPVNFERDEITIRGEQNTSYNYDSYASLSPIQAYLVKTCQMIDQNWQPPEVDFDSTTIILTSISHKGDILTYNIESSSGNAALDKSAVDALYKTKPYLPLPTDDKTIGSMEFRFVFHRTLSNKRVEY